MSNCTRDEGRSLGVGLQDQAPNHRKLRTAKGVGGERCGKGGLRAHQVRPRKTNESEPPMRCRKNLVSSKPGFSGWPGTSLGEGLLTAQAVTGIEAA